VRVIHIHAVGAPHYEIGKPCQISIAVKYLLPGIPQIVRRVRRVWGFGVGRAWDGRCPGAFRAICPRRRTSET
jgi:hypothetical protein